MNNHQIIQNNIPTEIGVINRDGFQLRYCIEGAGIPALIIGSSIYYPRTFSSKLCSDLRLIYLDHRGFAKSTQASYQSKTELDVILNDIESVRKKLTLEKIIIIGHSGHGYMALEYAKKYPEHVSHVVLIGMGPDTSQNSHDAADQYFQDCVCPERKAVLEHNLKFLESEISSFPERRFITFCLRLGARSWYDYKFDATPLWEDVAVNMPIMDHLWGTVFRDIDITQGLASFKKPVFLALGQYDFLVAPFFTWNLIRSKFYDLTMRLFEKSGHTPQLEEPELFNQELLKWIQTTHE